VTFINVEIRTGDTFCAEAGISAIDLLKIDTEGYDYYVLQGFKRMLREKRIRVIQFENIAVLAENVNTPMSKKKLLIDIIDLLGNDYVIGAILPSGVDFARYARSDEFISRNYIAVLKTCDDVIASVSLPKLRLI
jgi:hypothetical protein